MLFRSFGDIVRAAILLLERLIAKLMQKVMEYVEKVTGKVADVVKEASEETEIRFHEKDEVIYSQEKKIPFPFNHYRKEKMRNKTEQLQQKNAATVKKSVIEQIKAEQKSVPAETKQSETERPPKPQPSVLAAKYPRLKEIEDRFKDQNRAIFEREKKRDKLKKELSECIGFFKGGRRKELQQEIDSIDNQISNMKKRFSSIVREYKFDSVQAFSKELNASKSEYLTYKAVRAEWDKTYGDKAPVSTSIIERLRQKEQIVKERDANRVHQAKQKDRGAR